MTKDQHELVDLMIKWSCGAATDQDKARIRALEEKSFHKKLNHIGSTESHIEQLYTLCENQGHEIIELRAKLELLERALLRHNHE